jgi:tetratricopeptide (TPR) repeat protein
MQPTEQIIERLQKMASRGVTGEVMKAVEAALEKNPSSPELWCFRGDLIQMCEDEEYFDEHYEQSDALSSYRKAASLDPKCAEAFESSGMYLDTFEDDLDGAEQAFRQALAIEPRLWSFYGLARVLAQAGRETEGQDVLKSCPFSGDENIVRLRGEIARGEWSGE